MRCTVVESPYSTPWHTREECIRYALWCCAQVEAAGEAAFASHLFYTQFIAETKEGRDRGLAYRDEISRRLLCKVARFVDIGETPGMYRDIDATSQVVTCNLEGKFRENWLAGLWPPCSVRLTPVKD